MANIIKLNTQEISTVTGGLSTYADKKCSLLCSLIHTAASIVIFSAYILVVGWFFNSLYKIKSLKKEGEKYRKELKEKENTETKDR